MYPPTEWGAAVIVGVLIVIPALLWLARTVKAQWVAGSAYIAQTARNLDADRLNRGEQL